MVPDEIKDYLDSPTVSNLSVFTLLSIGVSEGRYIASDDVPMAYINAKRKVTNNSKKIYMKLNKAIVDIILKNDPSFAEFVDSDGTAVVYQIPQVYGMKKLVVFLSRVDL